MATVLDSENVKSTVLWLTQPVTILEAVFEASWPIACQSTNDSRSPFFAQAFPAQDKKASTPLETKTSSDSSRSRAERAIRPASLFMNNHSVGWE